jgi:nicotinate dehydrogenase subunit B
VNGLAFDRREFAAGLGAIVVAFSLHPKLARGQERLPGSLENNRRLDAWIRINPEGGATIFTGKVELGQGILTALAQIAAEELDLPLSRIEMISGDTGRTPNEGHTDGSRSIENSGMALRMAAAEVRAILMDLAAKRLGATADRLTLAEGVITAPGGRKVGYGELAAAVDLRREATAKVAPKTTSKYNLVGQSVQRLDIPAKVTGGAATSRTFDCRACCTAVRCARRVTARSSKPSMNPQSRQCPELLPSCATAASSASSRSARSRRSRRVPR